jgi:glycosyltransferase involved in cell wall biosynthesis
MPARGIATGRPRSPEATLPPRDPSPLRPGPLPLGEGVLSGRRLRLGIDAHAIGERRTGNERFIANVVRELRGLCEHELVLYFTRPESAAAWPSSPGTEVRLLRPANPVLRIPVVLPVRAFRDRLDALLVQYTGPPFVSCPVVTVVHDVAFALFPQYFSLSDRLWMGRTIPATMRRAASVVTVSEFSRDEIRRVYGLRPGRVVVAPNGVDPVFLARPDRPGPRRDPFFLAVGNLQPRKNVATLIRAYRRLLEWHPEVPERLVVVGQEWLAEEAAALRLEAADLTANGRVVFAGYVQDTQLVDLMREATAFAYPSLYEGFGLPPLEAMAAGTPALVSDIPVMREVVGDAAVRLPATDVEAWAKGLLRVATDGALREDLARRGPQRAARFTWQASARVVLAELERAAALGRRGRVGAREAGLP